MKKILWFQRLGLMEVVFCCIKGIFSEIVVNYNQDNISIRAQLFLRALKKIRVFNVFHPIELRGDKKDSSGHTLFYGIYKYMENCIGRFNNTYISDEPEWFKKMVISYLFNWTSNPFHFIAMINKEIQQINNAEHEVYIIGYPANSIVEEFHEPEDFKIKIIYTIREFFFYILRSIYNLLKLLMVVILYKVGRFKIRTNVEKIRPSVWVEYEGIKTMLSFWRDFINADEFDLIYYFDRPDTLISQENFKKSEQDGFKWIDFRKPFFADKLKLKDMQELIFLLFSYKFRYPLWLHFFRLNYTVLYKIYHSMFKHFQVKILIQHQNHSWIQQVQAAAIESAGGIMVGFHWSVPPVPLSFFISPEHVYFVWGKIIYMQKKGDTCKYILPCGVWITENILPKNEIKFAEGISFILAILDSSVDNKIYQTPETLSQFYLTVLSLLEDNPSWGGLAKSKCWILDDMRFLPRGDEIISKIKLLIEKKQLFILSPIYSPLTASAYANLTVTYGLQTAGIVAGVAGHKTVLLDVAGWLKNPFYKDLNQKFIYSTLDELEQAIIKASKGEKTIGDFSKWRQRLNYFDDFKAPERVGKFIQTFMDEVIKTDNMEYSLDFAVKRYIEENNIGEDFFKPDDWWDE